MDAHEEKLYAALRAPQWAQRKVRAGMRRIATAGLEHGNSLHPGLRAACLLAGQTTALAFAHPAIAGNNPDGITDGSFVYIPLHMLGGENEPLPIQAIKRMTELVGVKLAMAVQASETSPSTAATLFSPGYPSIGSVNPRDLCKGLQLHGAADLIALLGIPSDPREQHGQDLTRTFQALEQVIKPYSQQEQSDILGWIQNIWYLPIPPVEPTFESAMLALLVHLQAHDIDAATPQVAQRKHAARL